MRDEKVVVPVSNDVPSNTVELSSVLNVSKVVVLILSPERECINAVSSLRKIFVPNPAPSPTPIPINFLIKTNCLITTDCPSAGAVLRVTTLVE